MVCSVPNFVFVKTLLSPTPATNKQYPNENASMKLLWSWSPKQLRSTNLIGKNQVEKSFLIQYILGRPPLIETKYQLEMSPTYTGLVW